MDLLPRISRRCRMRWEAAVLATGVVLLPQACGNDSVVDPPEVAQLAFVTQPVSTEGQVAFDPAIRVAIQDASGNTVTKASSEVSIALAANPAGATLSGTTTVRAVNGIATFDTLTLDLPGDGFVFEARRAGLLPVLSVEFSVRLTFAHVSPGQAHACGLTASGFAYCWGVNSSGQLGDGSTEERHTPGPVKGRLRFRQISVGPHHACGTTTDNSAYCWGDNLNGRLGDGTTEQRREPTSVTGGLDFVQVSTAAYHTCGVTADHSAYCWGMTFGENSVVVRFTPTPVEGGLRFLHLSVGHGHTCGVDTDSIAYCWGGNEIGQLGDGTTTSRLTPAPIVGGLKFVQLSAGYQYTCGVTTGSAAYCWGYGGNGRLGDGTTSSRLSPTPVEGGLSFVQLSAGAFWHTCGVTTGNAAYCWGYGGDGQLGDGTTGQRLVPTAVSGDAPFVQVGAGTFHTCGVSTSDVAYCWGSNDHGQLGDGTTEQRLTPTALVQ